ncbi:MAG: DUF1380 family protein [Chloroflexi bacterium]|nr:DUF1380 family protein [Chloroflexota bacterium]
MPTVQEIIERLQRQYNPDEHVAVHIWCEEDVLGKAEELGYLCTKEEAQEILDDIHQHIDCELGITWDTLACYIQDTLQASPDPKEEEEGEH